VLVEQSGRPAAAAAAQQLAALTATAAGRAAAHAAVAFMPPVQSALLQAASHAAGYLQAGGGSAAAAPGGLGSSSGAAGAPERESRGGEADAEQVGRGARCCPLCMLGSSGSRQQRGLGRATSHNPISHFPHNNPLSFPPQPPPPCPPRAQDDLLPAAPSSDPSQHPPECLWAPQLLASLVTDPSPAVIAVWLPAAGRLQALATAQQAALLKLAGGAAAVAAGATPAAAIAQLFEVGRGCRRWPGLLLAGPAAALRPCWRSWVCP
jgi:hypothetical protein